MKLSYRFKLVFVITTLSVLLTAASVFIYYQYTYRIMMESISKNLRDVSELVRMSLDESDMERLQRLKAALEPYISYTEDEIKYIQGGGVVSNLPADVIKKLQSSDDFQFLTKKISRLMLLTLDAPYAEKLKPYSVKKTREYFDKGGVMPYLVTMSDKYSKQRFVQTLVASGYDKVEGVWMGNPIGTTWYTALPDEILLIPDVYVHNELYTDAFYTALYSTATIFDKNGKFVACLEMDYPVGQELNKLRNLRTLSYILIFISFIASLLLSLYFSKRMSGSLKKLTDAAEQIKDNNYDVRTDISREDEFGKLGSAFNNMAEAVQKTTTDLQKSNDRLMSLTADMHDGVGAVLTSIQIATRKDSETDIDNIHSLAEQGMGEIRFLMDAMEYESSTFELLTEGITLLAVDILQPRKIDWVLETEGDNSAEMPFQMYLDVQRIAREVFANVIKHSDANRCVIHLRIIGDTIWLTVEDNGHELEKPLGTSGGKGLKNIRHRVLRYEGDFNSEKTESGFHVKVSLKIPV
ncbi:HAMP domain-containing protein [Seleniivibrio woodruffii]|uniref:sensor histidine kinase n=1 Tax=Seleniivibrio woodruffii TaxID=1078050 RepID=UPI0026EBA152|nr:HAMP domain-containing protein [Seleniivibrio woodruffii]